MLTFHQTISLTFKPSLNDSIQFKNGKKFRCISFGKGMIDGEYQDYYRYREFNTENVPSEFIVTPQKYYDAMIGNKMIKV
jgi:hypothetical protein